MRDSRLPTVAFAKAGFARRDLAVGFAAALTVAGVIHAQPAPRLPLRAAAETITAADLLRDITYLASDELAPSLHAFANARSASRV